MEGDTTRDLNARVQRESGTEWYRWWVHNEWVEIDDGNEIDADALRERIQGTIETSV